MTQNTTPNYKDCPCIECILVAICRHRPYDKLARGCSILKPYIFRAKGIEHKKSCRELVKAINPTKWRLGRERADGYDLEVNNEYEKLKDRNES